MQWESVGVTDRGRKRQSNEDSFLVLAEEGLFAVADGMGGHAAGEVASAMAVATLENGADVFGGRESVADALADATRAANRAINERGARERGKAGMGTTLTTLALLPDEGACVIAHVGDSRCYRLHGGDAQTAGTLDQLTTDHTTVQERVERGLLTPTQARHHPLSNMLTRALGTEPDVEVDVVESGLEPGDLLLLCSDGLTAMVEDDDLEQILAQHQPLDEHARQLIEAANLRGGSDNVTVVLIRVTA